MLLYFVVFDWFVLVVFVWWYVWYDRGGYVDDVVGVVG